MTHTHTHTHTQVLYAPLRCFCGIRKAENVREGRDRKNFF